VERGNIMQRWRQIYPICFDELDGPPVVVGSRNWITPAPEQKRCSSPALVLLDSVHEEILPLPGYQPTTNRTTAS